MWHFSHTVASYDSECNTVNSFAFVLFSLGASCAHGVSEYRCILHLSLWTVTGRSAPMNSHQGVPPSKHWCRSGVAKNGAIKGQPLKPLLLQSTLISLSQGRVVPAEVIAKSSTIRMLIPPQQYSALPKHWVCVHIIYSTFIPLRGDVRIVWMCENNEWSVWCYLSTKACCFMLLFYICGPAITAYTRISTNGLIQSELLTWLYIISRQRKPNKTTAFWVIVNGGCSRRFSQVTKASRYNWYCNVL